jgi:prepilin-type N-terminal cleavage/methylation domain-containing protein
MAVTQFTFVCSCRRSARRKGMKGRIDVRRGFTLVEVLVVIAIIGILIALLIPAVQAARESARRVECANNINQISKSILGYEAAYGGLPPMAYAWPGKREPLPGNTMGWVWEHSWFSLTSPYLGYDSWASRFNFAASYRDSSNAAARFYALYIKVHACPSDIGIRLCSMELNSGNHSMANYVVNAGNRKYGQQQTGVPSPNDVDTQFRGAPFVGGENSPTRRITDGLAKTLMLSETLVLAGPQRCVGPMSMNSTSHGGQTFTGWNPPNSRDPDEIGTFFFGASRTLAIWQKAYRDAGFTPDTWPVSASNIYATRLTARSRHKGGVNASRCDGSISFYSDTINRDVWAALSSARGAAFEPDLGNIQ